jgi:hypothetical protein
MIIEKLVAVFKKYVTENQFEADENSIKAGWAISLP